MEIMIRKSLFGKNRFKVVDAVKTFPVSQPYRITRDHAADDKEILRTTPLVENIHLFSKRSRIRARVVIRLFLCKCHR